MPGAGLNLTRATLDATLKYPWLGPGEDASASGKYGAYGDDADVFAWIRAGAPTERPCLEAQVMDWADDVAYSVHDLEDGLHAGLVTFDMLRDSGERQVVAKLTLAAYCPPGFTTEDELAAEFTRLVGLDCWPREFDGSLAASAAVKNLTSELIGRFCRAAQAATRPAGHPPVRRYEADLVVPRQQRLECALLKGVTAHYVMSRSGVVEAQAREREIIAGLAHAITAAGPGALDPLFRAAYADAGDDAARLRVVIDQIASLTDTSALAWHERLRARGYPKTAPARRGVGVAQAGSDRVRDALEQAGREPQELQLGLRQCRRHRARQPRVARGHVQAQRGESRLGQGEQDPAAIARMDSPGDEPGGLQARQRPRERLRLHPLGGSQIARRQLAAAVQVAQHAQFERRAAVGRTLQLEPAPEAHDAAADGARDRRKLLVVTHEYKASTY